MHQMASGIYCLPATKPNQVPIEWLAGWLVGGWVDGRTNQRTDRQAAWLGRLTMVWLRGGADDSDSESDVGGWLCMFWNFLNST